MLSFLTRPYPSHRDPKKRFITALGIGLFIFLFLLVFQPFGLGSYTGKDKIIILAGYGLISFLSCVVTMLLVPLLFRSWFREEAWKAGKELLMTALTILLIGTLNLLYSSALGFVELNFTGFLYFQLITLAVGLLPAALFIMLKENQLLRQNLHDALEMNRVIESHRQEQPAAVTEPIIFSAENGKAQVRLRPEQVLFLSAAENYVEIYWTDNGRQEKTILRSTLARMEDLLRGRSDFFRCHRAYIVNLRNIQSVEGNAQGYRVRFPSVEKPVPVSRGLLSEFRVRMSG